MIRDVDKSFYAILNSVAPMSILSFEIHLLGIIVWFVVFAGTAFLVFPVS